MKRGKPMLADKDENRCIAATVMTEWKKAHEREERCPFMAKWEVDGKHFCRHHAVLETFAICNEKGWVKRLTTPPPVVGQHVRLAAARSGAKGGKRK